MILVKYSGQKISRYTQWGSNDTLILIFFKYFVNLNLYLKTIRYKDYVVYFYYLNCIKRI
jgi:hypothetical protein